MGYLAGGFFVRWLGTGEPFALASAGTIPLSNIAIGLKVSLCLYAAFEALAIFRPTPSAGGGPLAGHVDEQISED